MRFVIENKTLVRCELADDERDVEVEVPDFVDRAEAVEGSYVTVDHVERIGAGAFEGASGRIARLVLPYYLRAVDRGAFAGLGTVAELVVHSYDDACSNEMCNDLDNPIACKRLTVLPNPRGSDTRESFFDLCLVDDTSITELEVDARVHVRYSPGRQLAECGGLGLGNVETLTYLLYGYYNVIDPYLVSLTEMHHKLRRLVFENCATVWVDEESRPSRCVFADSACLEEMPSLEEVVLPEGLERIGECLFRDDPSLRSVYVPLSVREIGDRAFWRCTSLQELSLPEVALEGTSPTAFFECPKLAMLKVVRQWDEPETWEHTASVPVGRWAAVTAVDRLVRAFEVQYPELRETFRRVEYPHAILADGSVWYCDPDAYDDPGQYWDYLFLAYRDRASNYRFGVADEERAKRLEELREVIFLLLRGMGE